MIDVHAAMIEDMYESSEVPGRIERERICRVWYEAGFIINLTTRVKQVDVHLVGRKSAALVIGWTASRVAQFDAFDV